MQNRERRPTPESIGRVVGKAIPSVQIQQVRRTRLWLVEQDEPFAEIDIHEDSSVAMLRVSASCAPQWAASVVSLLHDAGASRVVVYPQTFMQTHQGSIVYGTDAEAYFRARVRVRPLITARFRDPS